MSANFRLEHLRRCPVVLAADEGLEVHHDQVMGDILLRQLVDGQPQEVLVNRARLVFLVGRTSS